MNACVLILPVTCCNSRCNNLFQFLKRFNMTGLLYNQYISGTKVLEISGKISHYKTTLPWLGPLRELDFGLFIAAISAVIKDVSRDSPWNASAFVMEHDGMTTQSFCSGFPWDKATSEVTAAATRAVFGKEIEELSALQYAHYAACSGGVLPLLDASPGGAQEFKRHAANQRNPCAASAHRARSKCCRHSPGWL
jgi:hypothetical protein